MNKKINVGIIGCGYWGPNLIRNFVNNPDCDVKKISDLRPGRLEFINSLYPDVYTTLDADEILNDKNIDAVVIATPVNTHKYLAVKAIEMGKDVLVEKPMTSDLNSAEELLNAAEKHEKIVAVGHIFQFAPAVTAIKKFIDHNYLGKVFHSSSQRINLGPPKTTVDVIWDLGPHDLSIIYYLYEEYPITVNVFGESCWWDNLIDNVHIHLEFPSKRTAHIHLSWLSSKKIRNMKIFGSAGNIEYDDAAADKVIFFDKGIDTRIGAKDNEVKNLQYGIGNSYALKLPEGEPLAVEVDSFLKAIITRKPPVNNGTIGKEVVKTLQIISEKLQEFQHA